jgi:L-aminopeptidase/D-esterase-like protein
VFPLGLRGAGRMAGVGKLPNPGTRPEAAGQGAAFRQIGEVRMAAFVVLNALGCILDREGRVVRGNFNPRTGRRVNPLDDVTGLAMPPTGNTTLSIVVTNQRLTGRDLTQLSRQVHASMARFIQPFHTNNDGDVLFFVCTNEEERSALADASQLGIVVSELLWDAALVSWD